jgi:DNA topoisomerase-1
MLLKFKAKDSVADKILSYNRANRAVAILCNHQRSVPKTFAKSMENMQAKIDQKKEQISDAEKEFKKAKSDFKNLKTVAAKKYVASEYLPSILPSEIYKLNLNQILLF